DSGFYPDEDMFLNVKLGIAVEYAKKEWTTATNANYTVQNILKVSSPYAAVGLGFEYNSFIIEGEYQFDLSAAQSLGGSSGWSMFSNRISVNIGYRFNGTLSGGGFGEVVTEEDPFAKYYQ
ncbi:MAG: hypothetical protein PWP46_1100, partial [Fusobacteriaceae bacterium]|nr:hypothetical protein [Fusobacteriaceae bacterium]